MPLLLFAEEPATSNAWFTFMDRWGNTARVTGTFRVLFDEKEP
jgi:hypothetical protein